MRFVRKLLHLLGTFWACATLVHGDDAGFVPIFDGATLDGWKGQDMSFWSVEDGAITGTIAPDHRPPMNQYLIWQGGLVEDFELKLDFRLTGSTTPDTNGGFQYRSRRLPNGDVAGYQVDNNFGQPWKVRLYDEFGRHDLALEGERAVISPLGVRTVTPLTLEPGARDFSLDQWHEYHLIARGKELALKINGNLVAEAIDDDGDQRESRGILAMQLHTGPPMKAQFRNIRLKEISVAPADSPAALIARAAFHWSLGRRPGTHQPPLEGVGEIVVGPSETADGAGFRVARMADAHFHAQVDLNAPRVWNVPGDQLTVRVRAMVPHSPSAATLFSKGSSRKSLHFRLGEDEMAPPADRELSFTIRTTDGVFRAAFPLSRIDRSQPHDFVGRYDGRSVDILCDGMLMARQSAAGELVPNDAPILIGAESDDAAPEHGFTGEIEEASLWPFALSDREVSQLSDR